MNALLPPPPPPAKIEHPKRQPLALVHSSPVSPQIRSKSEERLGQRTRKPKIFLALLMGVGIHILVIVAGAIFFKKEPEEEKKVVIKDVQILDEKKDKEQPEPEREKTEEPIEEQDLDLAELKDVMANTATAAAPALAAISLSDLSSALSGGGESGGMSSFAGGLGSAGIVGGTGGPGGTGGGGDMLSSAQLDSKPSVLSRVQPKYTSDMKSKGIKGQVVLLLVVAADGAVMEAKAVESDHPDLLNSSLEAVRQWRFKPGTRDGKSVPFKMRLPLKFGV